jgi:transposase
MTMTTTSVMSRAHDVGVPDGEDLVPRPRRRTFDGGYKERILAEYDSLPVHSSERGALLRREGLYTSHLAEWRNCAARAARSALKPKPPGPKRSSAEKELVRAQERIGKLEADLAATKLALEITGKAHALLEMLSQSAATDKKSTP